MNILFLILASIILVVAFILFISFLVFKKYKLALIALVCGLLLSFGYIFTLFFYSYSSRTTYILKNTPKWFCSISNDCNLSVKVVDIRTAEKIGEVKAQQIFYIVKLAVFNDSDSKILALDAPIVEMIDKGSRIYTRISKAEEQLPLGTKFSFNQPLAPNTGFEKEVVFDYTEPDGDLILRVRDSNGLNRLIERFLIGDEDSLFHKETFFILKMNTAS